jgi:hypothetical protein
MEDYSTLAEFPNLSAAEILYNFRTTLETLKRIYGDALEGDLTPETVSAYDQVRSNYLLLAELVGEIDRLGAVRFI